MNDREKKCIDEKSEIAKIQNVKISPRVQQVEVSLLLASFNN
jgi:hypothetical protein